MEYLEKGNKAVPACPVTCLLCHTSPYGGDRTVRTTGFVQTLREQAGVVAPPVAVGQGAPIESVLASLETAQCAVPDSPMGPCNTDREGLDDIAELRAGTDPQGSGELSDCPQYGCGAKAERARPPAQSQRDLPPVGAVTSIAFLLFVRQLTRHRNG
jgi:hypothetical protein